MFLIAAPAQAFTPDRTIEFMVHSGPGAGNAESPNGWLAGAIPDIAGYAARCSSTS